MFSKNDLCSHFKFLSFIIRTSTVRRIDTTMKVRGEKERNDVQKWIAVRYRNTEDMRRFNVFIIFMQVSKFCSSMLSTNKGPELIIVRRPTSKHTTQNTCNCCFFIFYVENCLRISTSFLIKTSSFRLNSQHYGRGPQRTGCCRMSTIVVDKWTHSDW